MKKKVLNILTLCLLIAGVFTTALVIINRNSNSEAESLVEENIDGSTSEDSGLIKMRKYANQDLYGNQTVTIEAQVSPVVIDNSLNWTIDWATSSTKDIRDYVRMTIGAETHSVILTHLQNFDTQIIVTATSNATPTVSASCTVDCYKRTTDIEEFGLVIGDGLNITQDRNELDLSLFSFNDVLYCPINDTTITTATVGTVASGNYTRTFKYRLSFSGEVNMLILKYQLDNNTTTREYISWDDWDGTIIAEVFEVITGNDEVFSNAEFLEELASVYHWLNVDVIVEDYHNGQLIGSYTERYEMYFDISDSMNVSEIFLDNSSVIF